MTRAAVIPTASIPLMWERILPQVVSFCDHSQGSYDPPYIYDKLLSGQMQAWLMMSDDKMLGITLTELRQTLIKELIIIVCTGEEMLSWNHLTSVLENYAKSIGCKKICGIAREGWKKILKPQGYHLTHVVLEKML